MIIFFFFIIELICITSFSFINLLNLFVNQEEWYNFFNLTMLKCNFIMLWKVVFKFNCIKLARLIWNKILSSDHTANDSITSINSLNNDINLVLFP